MKKSIIMGIIFLVLIISVICLVSFNNNNNITHIKFNMNSAFILAVDKDNNVRRYNALNASAGVYNLTMFEDRGLDEVITNLLKDTKKNSSETINTIKLTIMTKNNERANLLYNTIKNIVNNYDNTINIVLKEPTREDLFNYSNETVYNQKPQYTNSNMKMILEQFYSKIDTYVTNKIKALKIKTEKQSEINNIIKTNYSNNYFNDFNIQDVVIDNLLISPRSKYNITFNFDENGYTYDLTIDLELNNYIITTKDGIRKALVEVYSFTYSDESIINYNVSFYKFNY